MSHGVTLGIDVGGTTIKSALVDELGTVLAFRRTATPRGDVDGSLTTTIISELVAHYASGQELAGVGVAVPGVVDDDAGIVIAAANLGWRDLPLRRMIEDAVHRKVAFSHDVRSGALAETAFADPPPPGRGGQVAAFVPIGTGIAAAIVIDGTPLVSGGWAGEIGQVAVSSNEGRHGLEPLTLERVASAAAIARRVGCLDARAAAGLVTEGNQHAVAVWADAVEALAESIAWMVAVVGADRIIVGGGLAESGELLLAPLRDAIDARLGMLRRPLVTKAVFGDRAATIGAGLLARRTETA